MARNDHDLAQGRNALRIRAEPAAKRTCELEEREELGEPKKWAACHFWWKADDGLWVAHCGERHAATKMEETFRVGSDYACRSHCLWSTSSIQQTVFAKSNNSVSAITTWTTLHAQFGLVRGGSRKANRAERVDNIVTVWSSVWWQLCSVLISVDLAKTFKTLYTPNSE